MILFHIQRYSIGILFLLFIYGPLYAYAQGGQILSVTPPLFQLSVAREDIWQSSVKVVNGNPYELTVFAEVVNFSSQGEHGQGTFVPILDGEDNATLAEWIEIAGGPHVIPPEQTKEISFFVEIPEDAPPGGHFAAILVGTQPVGSGDGNLAVLTSQYVTSLFFVRIEGDVIEAADIREFSMEDRLVEEPEASFLLRFENKGNVHLQPRGDIIITNMWGSERGIIPINNQTHFGNVLPQSIREFNFSWRGEGSITEIGRHKAIVTLAYGEDGIKSTSATTYFWVVPIRATLITLVTIVAFIFFVAWAIRLYIRKMLSLAGLEVESSEAIRTEDKDIPDSDVRLTSYRNVSAPLKSGAKDLKRRMENTSRFVDVCVTLFEFVLSYKRFFGAVLIIVVGFIVGVLYIADASKEQKNYEVTIQRGDGETIVNSEDILKDRIQEPSLVDGDNIQPFELIVVNETDEVGRAALEAVRLENAGFRVTDLEIQAAASRMYTLITYTEGLIDEALELQESLNVSTSEVIRDDAVYEIPRITIQLGKDTLE